MQSIRARDLFVEYPVYDVRRRSLRHHLVLNRLAAGRQRTQDNLEVGGHIASNQGGRVLVRALNNVTFDIEEGERVGLIGRNGSGKTTLLRTISGIYEPIRGRLEVKGRVTPLFDMSIGMDQDATGIENIRLRGRLLGFDEATISRSTEEIANFSELGDYLDMPIRTYSAGMMVRLAFAISTTIEPEILVLDEMIGAGDAGFIDRARDRLRKLVDRTGILVVASHSGQILREWCTRGMVLSQGQLVMSGPIDEAVAYYEDHVADAPAAPATSAAVNVA